jgi:uncharacterized membrane protein YvbJ
VVWRTLNRLYAPHRSTAQSFHAAINRKDIDKLAALLKLPEARDEVLKANRKNEIPLVNAIKNNNFKMGTRLGPLFDGLRCH